MVSSKPKYNASDIKAWPIDTSSKWGTKVAKYSRFSKEGYEIPVISAQIKYKISFKHGEKVLLLSKFNLVNKIRINCKTLFLKTNGKIGAEALIELVIVRKKDDKIKLVRELPSEFEKLFLLLEEGQEI